MKAVLKKILKHSVFENFLSLMILQGINSLIPLVTYPFLFRVLGVENFGVVNFALSFIQYFIILTDFGFDLSAVKKISEHKHDHNKIQSIYNNVIYAKIGLTMFGFLVLLVLICVNQKLSANTVLYLLAYMTVLGSSIFPTWFFQGMEKMKFITVINVVAKAIAFLPMFYFIRSADQFSVVPLFYGLGYMISGVIGMFVVYQKFNIRITIPIFGDIYNEIKYSFLYFLSRASLSIYTITNVVVIGFALDDIAVGYYSSVEKIHIAITAIYAPFILAIYPYMSRTRNISMLKRTLFSTSVLNVVVILIIMLFAEQIVEILYKSNSPEMINTLKILLLGCFIYIPSVLLGYPLLGVTGHEKQANSSIIFSSLFHIILLLSLYFFSYLTIYTVAMTRGITSCIELSIRIYWVKKFKLLKIHE